MKTKLFAIKHPAPTKMKRSIWPIFLPFAGCKKRCIFCSQEISTGRKKVKDFKALVSKELTELEFRAKKNNKVYGVGFFGGTFTGLPYELQSWILERVVELRCKNIVDFVCLSTRPDFINNEVAELLKSKNVDLVELGIQSFDSEVLDVANRGYTLSTILKAIHYLKKYNLKYGFQLLPGLPKHNLAKFWQDIELTICLKPSTLRIYPCLVLENTLLAKLYRLEQYRPWSIEKTVYALGFALLDIWRNNIKILRIGLTPERSLLANIIAGPWHEALGFMVRSFALNMYLKRLIASFSWQPTSLEVPSRYLSELWGYKNVYQQFWYNLVNGPTFIKIGPFKEFVFMG